MKISWQTQENGETYIFVKGENDDNPIGTCRKTLTNGKFSWKIIPWFNTWGMDSRTFNELFDNDDILTFDTTSGNTIVLNSDLKFETPKA